jgi:hypothetical protein
LSEKERDAITRIFCGQGNSAELNELTSFIDDKKYLLVGGERTEFHPPPLASILF